MHTQHVQNESSHWVSKSVTSWIGKLGIRSFLWKPSVTGLWPLSSLVPTDILTVHTLPVRCVSQFKHALCSTDVQRRPYFNSPPSLLLPVSTSSPRDLCFFFLLFFLEPCQTLGSNSPISPNPWVMGRKSELVERPVLIMWERKWFTRLYGNVHTFQLLPPKWTLCS